MGHCTLCQTFTLQRMSRSHSHISSVCHYRFVLISYLPCLEIPYFLIFFVHGSYFTNFFAHPSNAANNEEVTKLKAALNKVITAHRARNQPFPQTMVHFTVQNFPFLPPTNEVLGQGHVFTPVRLFTGGRSVHHPHSQTWGGSAQSALEADPPPPRFMAYYGIRPTSNKQAVHILLDCILVLNILTTRKQSCGQVMFLHLSVILFTRRSWGSLSRGRGGGGGSLSRRGGSLSRRASLGETPLPGTVKSGRYASYWNALLLGVNLHQNLTLTFARSGR